MKTTQNEAGGVRGAGNAPWRERSVRLRPPPDGVVKIRNAAFSLNKSCLLLFLLVGGYCVSCVFVQS